MTLAVCDYGLGNMFSVLRALEVLGIEHQVDTDGSVVSNADRILIPGVGAFGDGAANLRASGQFRALQERHAAGIPIVGVCLGAQLLLDSSDEAPDVAGLGIIAGSCVRLDGAGSRVPNQDWHRVAWASPVGNDLENQYFYFSHSYVMRPMNPGVVWATVSVRGQAIVAAVREGTAVGVQFHPERSGESGLRALGRLVSAEGAAREP